MKRIYKNLLTAALVVTVFSACDKTEGTLFSGEPNKASFFAGSTTLTMGEGTMDVPVGRTSTQGALSIPVTLSSEGAGYTDVFSVTGPVVFADGEAKAYAKIQIADLSTISPSAFTVTAAGMDVNAGLAFPMTLSFPEEYSSPSETNETDVLAQLLLDFESLGTTEMNSEEGWWGEVIHPEIQKAVGANVYKVVSPFGANSIAFLIDPDGTVDFPNQVMYLDTPYGAVTMRVASGTYEDGWVTLNVSGWLVNTPDGVGSYGTGIERIKIPD